MENMEKTKSLIIKEIYYGGCIGENGNEYMADQYVTLFNNSDETIYLDGLCVAVIDPMGSIESPWMKYTDMARIPVNDLAWQFPGSGNEYPLLPRTGTTIATNAINHIGEERQYPNSVDLSTADWRFWDESLGRQDNTSDVTPMKLISKLNPTVDLYLLSTIDPAFMVFSIQGTTTEAYVNNPDNLEHRPQSSNQHNRHLMIPKEWVIDCIDCVKNQQQSLKRVPDELDNGAAYIPDGPYSGKSLVRKSSFTPDGQIVYQDTNNSAEDFRESIPEFKNDFGRFTLDPSKCSNCQECIDACLRVLLVFEDNRVVMTDTNLCNQCERCLDVCPTRAISFP